MKPQVTQYKKPFFSRKIIISFRVFLIIALLDFFTKLIVKLKNISTTGHFVDINYQTNTGSLWSLFSNLSEINTIFIIASITALVVLFLLWKKEQKYYVAFALVLAGIFGNFLDRIMYGFVVDWIDFHFWPIFNIADSAIVIGVLFLLFITLKSNSSKKIIPKPRNR